MNLLRLIRKEIIQISRSIKMVTFIGLWPIVIVFFVAKNNFETSILSIEATKLFLLYMPSLLSFILVSDNLVKEKRNGTYEILLISKFKYGWVLFSKAIVIPFTALLSQLIQLLAIIIFENMFGVSMISFSLFGVFLFIPVLTYLAAITLMVVGAKLNIEKIGEQLLYILVSAISGIILLGIYTIGSFNSVIGVVSTILIGLLLCILLTAVSAKFSKAT